MQKNYPRVPVFADADGLAAQTYETFDVELVLRQVVDALGREHDDLAALGRTEVVGYPVNKEMISLDERHTHGTAGNFKRLNKITADKHRQNQGNQNRLNPFTQS